jgi:hypothetical protein
MLGECDGRGFTLAVAIKWNIDVENPYYSNTPQLF